LKKREFQHVWILLHYVTKEKRTSKGGGGKFFGVIFLGWGKWVRGVILVPSPMGRGRERG